MDYNEYSVLIGNAELVFSIGKDIAWECENYKSDSHFHGYHEIIYLCSGELEVITENNRISVAAKEVVIIPKNLVHELYSKDKHYRLTFSVNLKKSRVKGIDMCENLEAVFAKDCAFTAESQQIADAFERLLTYYYGKIDCKYELIRAMLTEITVLLKNELSYRSEIDSVNKNQTDGYRVFIIEQYLYDNFAKNPSLSELSGMLNLSVCHTQRVFESIYAMPFRSKIIQMRMIHAKALLEKTGKSLSEISGEAGYANPQGFFAAFKRYCGMTPTQYRKNKCEME